MVIVHNIYMLYYAVVTVKVSGFIHKYFNDKNK